MVLVDSNVHCGVHLSIKGYTVQLSFNPSFPRLVEHSFSVRNEGWSGFELELTKPFRIQPRTSSYGTDSAVWPASSGYLGDYYVSSIPNYLLLLCMYMVVHITEWHGFGGQ